MRAKFGGDPTAGSKNLPFKFNNICNLPLLSDKVKLSKKEMKKLKKRVCIVYMVEPCVIISSPPCSKHHSAIFNSHLQAYMHGRMHTDTLL